MSTRIQPGDPFPADALPLRAGVATVVWFYPKAGTAVCTRQAQLFAQRHDDFRSAGVDVVGVSVGTPDETGAFAAGCGVPFPMVSDDGTLSERLGVLRDFGEHGVLSERVTLLVAPDGTVAHVWDVSDVAANVDEVLGIVADL